MSADENGPSSQDPNRPVTGKDLEDWSAEMNDEVVEKLALFDTIYLAYPRHTEFHSRCDLLVKLGRATRGRPQKGLRVLAPSGSGKSTAAEAFIRLVEAKTKRTETDIPIVMIKLDRATTSKKLICSILDEFEDAYVQSGTEFTLKKRMYACFTRFNTELLVIDEVQHLNFRREEKNDVTDMLKRLLDDGVVPVVFLGTDDATDMFTRNVQLAARLLSPCDFSPLRYERPLDRELLTQYVVELDRAMVAVGLVPQLSGLGTPWIRGCLAAVSGGVIGRISRLLYAALEIAARRGADYIEAYDLAEATDRWAIAQEITTGNPFRKKGQA